MSEARQARSGGPAFRRRFADPRPLLAATLLAAFTAAAPGASALQGHPPCRGEIVVDAATMEVLHERNAETPLPTASMIKMLTALTAVEAIEAGEVSWDTPYTVTYDAARVGGSQVYLKQGEVFPLRDLLRATLIESANDAAYAVAEVVGGGSVEAFLRRMRAKAREFGVETARIHSPNGLPHEDGRSRDDAMAAHDLALLGAAVLEHPQLRTWVRTKTAPFRRGEFQLYNSNHLLRRYPYAEGIKTGYHRFARFGITSAASKDGVRLIAALAGCDGKGQVFGRAEQLFEEHFEEFMPTTVVERGAELLEPAPVRGGEQWSVPVVAGDEVRLMLRDGVVPQIQTIVVGNRPEAPVRAGQRVGVVEVRRGGRVVAEVPAVAAEDVEAASFWTRWWRLLFDRSEEGSAQGSLR